MAGSGSLKQNKNSIKDSVIKGKYHEFDKIEENIDEESIRSYSQRDFDEQDRENSFSETRKSSSINITREYD